MTTQNPRPTLLPLLSLPLLFLLICGVYIVPLSTWGISPYAAMVIQSFFTAFLVSLIVSFVYFMFTPLILSGEVAYRIYRHMPNNWRELTQDEKEQWQQCFIQCTNDAVTLRCNAGVLSKQGALKIVEAHFVWWHKITEEAMEGKAT